MLDRELPCSLPVPRPRSAPAKRNGVRRLVLASALVMLSLWSIAPGSLVAGAATKAKAVIDDVTVTAGKPGGDSAVSLNFTNDSKQPVTLLGVTSSVARKSMIDYDVNMCQGNHGMSQLSDIYVTSGTEQHLGYQFQGAMLSGLDQRLVVGQEVQVTVTWRAFFGSLHRSTIEAKVVAPPKGLKFIMAAMSM